MGYRGAEFLRLGSSFGCVSALVSVDEVTQHVRGNRRTRCIRTTLPYLNHPLKPDNLTLICNKIRGQELH